MATDMFGKPLKTLDFILIDTPDGMIKGIASVNGKRVTAYSTELNRATSKFDVVRIDRNDDLDEYNRQLDASGLMAKNGAFKTNGLIHLNQLIIGGTYLRGTLTHPELIYMGNCEVRMVVNHVVRTMCGHLTIPPKFTLPVSGTIDPYELTQIIIHLKAYNNPRFTTKLERTLRQIPPSLTWTDHRENTVTIERRQYQIVKEQQE